MKAMALVLLAPALLGAAKKPAPNPNAALFAHVRAAVAEGLKDPESAHFRPLSVVTDGDGSRKVCGEVNAKNEYGGYTGYTAFAYLLDRGDVAYAPQPEDDRASEINRLGSGCPGFGDWRH